MKLSKNFSVHKNRGMLLEQIINKTIIFYNKHNIGFFAKNNLNINFKKVNSNLELVSSYINSKSTVDYYGIYNGRYITFEAKSTELDTFPFTNIKEHQHKHLKLIKKLGGCAFYLIYFKHINQIYFIDVDYIDFENKKCISLDEIQKYGKNLEIVFPGIIDFLNSII